MPRMHFGTFDMRQTSEISNLDILRYWQFDEGFFFSS